MKLSCGCPGGDGSRRRREEADALEDKAAQLEAQQAQRTAQVQGSAHVQCRMLPSSVKYMESISSEHVAAAADE